MHVAEFGHGGVGVYVSMSVNSRTSDSRYRITRFKKNKLKFKHVSLPKVPMWIYMYSVQSTYVLYGYSCMHAATYICVGLDQA